jgi:hypothetical protein
MTLKSGAEMISPYTSDLGNNGLAYISLPTFLARPSNLRLSIYN